jgi:hypothetical protein
MQRFHLKYWSLLVYFSSAVAFADPIHAITDGAYWHHDSGWVFAQKIGEFELVGIPQDVAGSRDAVAYYARTDVGVRTVAAVDVYPEDSARVEEKVAGDLKQQSEDAMVIGPGESLRATRVVYASTSGSAMTVRYFIAMREWRVRIEVKAPASDATTLPALDAFVRGQRWESLAGHAAAN